MSTIESPCGGLGCPEGYTLTPDGTCEQINIVPPASGTTSVEITGGSNSPFYAQFGTRFYGNIDALTLPLVTTGGTITPSPPTYLQDDNGAGPNIIPTVVADCGANCVWQANNASTGRLNIAGLWTDQQIPCGDTFGILGWSASNPQWIGFSVCVDVPTTGVYCVGLAADNRMRFSINGDLVAEWRNDNTFNFQYWNVIEVTLQAGLNYVEVEGFNLACSSAAFAAEIYQADTATLQAVTNLNAGDPNGLEDYIIFSTRDLIPGPGDPPTFYDIGTDSGNVCPEGYAYDGCSDQGCIQILTTDPIVTECCWIIENCDNPEEQYAIQLVDDAPGVAIGVVYEFGGDPIFTGECYTIVDEVECETPDYTDITVVTTYGYDACLSCSPSEEFQSCDNPEITLYVSIPNLGDAALTIGNVYELTADDNNCYTYIGTTDENPPTLVTDIVDLDTDYCLICTPCHKFQACDDESIIFVRFADGFDAPDLNEIVELGPFEAIEDRCWEYLGTATCDVGDEDYTEVVITKDYECTTCDVCKDYYKLTQCCGDTIYVVEWAPGEPPLDVTQTYTFDFDPDKCFSVESIPNICGEDPESQLPTLKDYNVCVYGFLDTLMFVNADIDETADSDHTVTSLTVNGTEYITGEPLTYPFPAGGGDVNFTDLNTVPANNEFNLTYTDQVEGMATVVQSLGLEDFIKFQVVTNDIWATTEGYDPYLWGDNPYTHGGFYLLLDSTVTTFSIEILDDAGYTKNYTWDNGVAGSELINPPIASLNDLGYDYFNCVDVDDNPFEVTMITPTDGVIEEPPFDE